jgi:uncharacterized membrane protein
MNANSVLSAAGYGWLAGMRSFAAPVAAGVWLRKQRRVRGKAARGLASPFARVALPALAATEVLIIDKLPWIPDRTMPASLAARIASGALAGAAIAQTRRRKAGKPAMTGALLGGGFALLSSYANLWLRRQASARTGISEQRAGLAEDALALSLGTALATA